MNRDPTTRATSAEASAIPPWTSPPRQPGWSSSRRPRAALVVTTGMPVRSAKAASAAAAPPKNAPEPATATGRSAPASSSTARSTSPPTGTDRPAAGKPVGQGRSPRWPARRTRPGGSPGTRRRARRTPRGAPPRPRTRGCARSQAFGAPLRHRPDQGELVEVLDRPAPPLGEPGPPGDHHDGHAGGVGLDDAGDGVGQARARGDRGRGGRPGGQGPPLGHQHGVLLVPGVDDGQALEPGAFEQREDVAAGEPEDRPHPRLGEGARREDAAVLGAVHGGREYRMPPASAGVPRSLDHPVEGTTPMALSPSRSRCGPPSSRAPGP